MPRSEIIRLSSLPALNPRRDRAAAALLAEGGHEMLAGDINAALARRQLEHVEDFFHDRLRSDSRIAGHAERLAGESPTAAPMLADSCEQYVRAASRIGEHYFIR